MLKHLLAELAELVPVVGDVIENVKSKDGGTGRFFKRKFLKQIVRLAGTIGILYLISQGQADVEDLEQLKNF